MQDQKEDLLPEEFQKKYIDYHMEYLEYFSEAVFKQKMGEDWFQDRYNPLNIVSQETQTAQWAKEESLRIKSEFLSNPVEFLKAVSLDPVSYKGRKSYDSNKKPDLELSKDDQEGTLETNINEQESVPGLNSEIFGKHLPGHEKCTIYVTGVHASCSKQVFTNAVSAALRGIKLSESSSESTTNDPMEPSRIILAQPTWSHRDLQKFERNAWIVMSSEETAKLGVQRLRDLEIKVPRPQDLNEADAATAFTFVIQATSHSPRGNQNLPDYMSHYERVKSDIRKATYLAQLLDEDRSVPEEHDLKSCFADKKLNESITKITDHLDFVIAYLRRVHFVAFYSAKRFRDEAHLLSMASNIAHRSSQLFIPPEESNTSYSLANFIIVTTSKEDDNTNKLDDEDEDLDASNVEGNKKDSEDHENDQPQPENEPDENEQRARGNDVAEEVDQSHSERTIFNLKYGLFAPSTFKYNIPLSDQRLRPLIAEVKKRVSIKRNKRPDYTPVDEQEANIIQEAQDRIYEQIVRSKCKFEPEDKCRCCYTHCNKLFRAVNFLVKHLKTKHESFAFESMIAEAEPYMKKRYNAEDITFRPLPQIQCESSNGFEYKSVKEIIEKYQAAVAQTVQVYPGFVAPIPQIVPFPPVAGFQPPPPPPPSKPAHNHNRRHSFGNNIDFDGSEQEFRGNKRTRDDRRVSLDSAFPDQRFQIANQPPPPNSPPPVKARQLSNYRDIDAPKVNICLYCIHISLHS